MLDFVWLFARLLDGLGFVCLGVGIVAWVCYFGLCGIAWLLVMAIAVLCV